VYNLDGSVRQTVAGLDRPNNVDIEGDLAVVAERLKNQLRLFRITAEGISDAGGARVFADRSGEEAAPMGIALYRRPRDGALFAIVAPKAGPRNGYLAQYRIENDPKMHNNATFVRYFGTFSGAGEIEAVAVDDALGFVYYADEGNGIHKYHADPDHPDAAREAAHFGRTGFRADREGIAIYARADGTGYIVCTDQLESNAEYHVYRREGGHSLVTVLRGGADSTDGIEVTSMPLGPRFPNGLMIAMNSKGRNFLVYRWPEALR
jgi:3-phytase